MVSAGPDRGPHGPGIDPQYLNKNYDPGSKYSVPYTIGTTLLAYRKDKVSAEPTSWSALWDEKYKGHIYMLDAVDPAINITMFMDNVSLDDVKAAASGLLSAEIREHFIGYAKIQEVFKITGVGKIAGCMVTEGVARRTAGVRLLRDNVVIHEGTLKTLKRFKDEVKEVQVGQECGMAFESYQDMRAGDVIECFTVESIQRSL